MLQRGEQRVETCKVGAVLGPKRIDFGDVGGECLLLLNRG